MIFWCNLAGERGAKRNYSNESKTYHTSSKTCTVNKYERMSSQNSLSVDPHDLGISFRNHNKRWIRGFPVGIWWGMPLGTWENWSMARSTSRSTPNYTWKIPLGKWVASSVLIWNIPYHIIRRPAGVSCGSVLFVVVLSVLSVMFLSCLDFPLGADFCFV